MTATIIFDFDGVLLESEAVLAGPSALPVDERGDMLELLLKRLDGVIQVDPADAKDYARRAASEEGMLVGISSGATLAAIAQKIKELPAGSRVLGFNYDTGERYLSVPDFLPE